MNNHWDFQGHYGRVIVWCENTDDMNLYLASEDLLKALEAYQNANRLQNNSDFELYDMAKSAIAKTKGQVTASKGV